MDFKKLLLISAGHLSCDLNGSALPALLPYLTAAHGFDYQMCGSLTFAYASVSSIVQPFLGLAADRTSRMWFIPLGILFAGCGLAAVGFLDSYLSIVMALVFCGMGGALFHPEGARCANLVSGNRKGVGLSLFSVGGNGGLVLGPLLVVLFVGGVSLPGGLVVGGFGLPGTIFFALIGLCTATLIFWRLSRWKLSPARPSEQAVVKDPLTNDWRAFGILMGCILTRAILSSGLNTYLPLYWTTVFQLPVQMGNLVLTFFCVFGVVGNLFGGAAADRWGFGRIIRLASFCTLPCIVLFPFLKNPYLAALVLVPIALGLFAPFSAMVVLGQRSLARNMGLASGITLGVAVSIGGMFAPVLGWIADTMGGLTVSMHVLGGVSLLGALISLAIRENSERR